MTHPIDTGHSYLYTIAHSFKQFFRYDTLRIYSIVTGKINTDSFAPNMIYRIRYVNTVNTVLLRVIHVYVGIKSQEWNESDIFWAGVAGLFPHGHSSV